MFDLKYRPRKFKDVLGNDGVKQLLIARIRQGTLGDQSMMLGGPKGCGKTTLARLIARSLLCSSITDGEPCGECPACVSILDETHPDVEELDAASQGTAADGQERAGGASDSSGNGGAGAESGETVEDADYEVVDDENTNKE